jgi:hypothetical protein
MIAKLSDTAGTTRVRCSSLPLFWQCPSSHDVQPDEIVLNESGEPAEAGTACHRWAAAFVRGKELDIPALAKEHGCDENELSMLCAMVRKALAALRQHFDAADGPMLVEQPLTATIGENIVAVGTGDIVARSGRTGICLDWKTGRVDSDYTHQLRGYALGALELLGEVDEIVLIVVWVRQGVWDVERLSGHHLRDWAAEFSRRVRNGRGNFNPGSHCQYCPRALDCPARRAMVRSTVQTFAEHTVVNWTPETRTAMAPAIGEMFGRVKLVEKACEEFRSALRADVDANGDLPIGGGRKIGLTQFNRRELDPALSRPVLSKYLTPEELDSITKISPSQAEQIAVSKAERGKGAATKRELAAALEAAGAVSVYPVTQLRELKE